jgi:general secretion pathway protein B
MSLILEALKKAERQHKLGEVPRITADSEQPTVNASRRLGWLMVTLMALILVGVGIYLGKSWLSPQQHQDETSVTHAAPLQKPDRSREIEPVVTQPPVPAIPSPRSAMEPQPVTPPLQVEDHDMTPVVEAEPEPEPEPTPALPPKPLHEMPSGFVANLPPLNIDIHSYDERPAKRYVLINMEKYREGDYLAEGPRVLEILSEGAVMEHMGERFILPIGN